MGGQGGCRQDAGRQLSRLTRLLFSPALGRIKSVLDGLDIGLAGSGSTPRVAGASVDHSTPA